MDTFIIKLILSPLLITVTTLTARRWGPVAGGLLVGLPLTSGPVSAFLAVEQGRDFAASAAQSTLMGLVAVVAFCVAYARISTRCSWPAAATVSLVCYFAGVALFSVITLPFLLSIVLVVLLIYAGTRAIKPATGPVPLLSSPPWDLPFRILVATAIIIAITTLSDSIGPRLSGLLSTFPAFITVMAAFTQALHGPDAARQFVRGVVTGSYSFAVFYLVIWLTIGSLNLFLVYLLATVMSAGINFSIYRFFVLPRKNTASSMETDG